MATETRPAGPGEQLAQIDVAQHIAKQAADFMTTPDDFRPLDPSRVKAGDTVTLDLDAVRAMKPFSVTGETYQLHGHGDTLFVAGWGINHPGVTLTAHTPASEPEPEWTPGRLYSAFVTSTHAAMRLYRNKGIDLDYWLDDAGRVIHDEDVADARPLVVIDPAEVDVDGVAETVRKAAACDPRVWAMQDAVRAVLVELGIEAS